MKRADVFLWLIYGGLLAVLLPHAQFVFARFEPNTAAGQRVAWAAAFVFEAAIAALTHKLSLRIRATPRYSVGRVWLRKLHFRYANVYFAGLLITTVISSLANLAHAVEFGGELAIVDRWGISFGVYAIAFGGVLPVVSILFASVLSNVAETERGVDPALVKAKGDLKDLRTELKAVQERANFAEGRLVEVEGQRALTAALFDGDKRERILAARELWPEAAARTWADISGASTGYVSEVVNSNGR